MMIDKKGVDDVIDILQSEAFTKTHKHILKPFFSYSQILNRLTY
jgi:hypothetical protein